MKEALLYDNVDEYTVKCRLCNHFCTIAEGKTGRCGVRKNSGGVFYSLSYGNIIASNCDPVEKKPLYHFLPGSRTYSIAAPGCNFQCSFCQNWQISQIQEKFISLKDGADYNPESIISNARATGCKSIAYTYTEPTVYYEVIDDIESNLKGNEPLYGIVVSNGFMSLEVLDRLNRSIKAYNIDLKSFSDNFYGNYCGGRLQPVLDTIKKIHTDGIWLEITTLLIPGVNDSMEELDSITSFIAGINTNIPWHISRFFPQYRFNKSSVTQDKQLELAKDIGIKKGLKHIYIGNTASENKTECPHCKQVLITRRGYSIDISKLFQEGKCTSCGQKIEGLWK